MFEDPWLSKYSFNFLTQGLPAPIFGAMVENASLFLAYSELQSLIRRVTKQPLSEKSSLPQLALAAAGAGMITSFLLFVHIISRPCLRLINADTPELPLNW
jgi:hypothetical protein